MFTPTAQSPSESPHAAAVPPPASARKSLAGDLAALLAPVSVLALYACNLWGSPAFGMLADQGYHLDFAREFHQAWTDGDFPPRWAPGSNGGRGSVGFVVYPPLFAFLTACWLRLGIAATNALRLAVLLASAATLAAVYYLARAWLSRRRSLFAAALVLLLPGVTFVCLGRGMFPNFAALGFVALLLAAGQRALLGKRPVLNVALAVLAASGLALTHTLTAYLLAFFLVLMAPLLFNDAGARGLLWAAGAAGAAAALTCWYWLPLLHSGAYTRMAYLAESHPYLDSVFGAAPPAAGSIFLDDWAFLNDIGRYIIVAQSLLALLIAVALRASPRDAPAVDARGSSGSEGGSHQVFAVQSGCASPKIARENVVTVPAGAQVLFLRALPWVAGFALLAAIEPVARLLLELPRVSLIQFAWRWQLLISLWCGVGIASLPPGKRSAPAWGLAAVALLFFAPLLKPVELSPADRSRNLPPVLSKQAFELLKPLDRSAYAGNLLELRPNQSDSRYYLPAPFGRIEVLDGEAAIEPQRLTTSHRRYLITAARETTLRIITYFAPGWSARLDAAPIDLTEDPASGLQKVVVPPGSHELALDYAVP